MTARRIFAREGAALFHATWQELVHEVDAVDLLATDTPYSERTHAGHDKSADEQRDPIDFQPWTVDDVRAFVEAWAPRTRGWFVSITDHELWPAWVGALEAQGRYTFAPVPFVHAGSRFRKQGDGPACITTWLAVARPRSKAFVGGWATEGAYVLPPGLGADLARPRIVGGKPRWLMHRIVEDYSREGQLVGDPCCGAGTTGRAALERGRATVCGDASADRAILAAHELAHAGAVQASLSFRPAVANPRQQLSLLSEAS